MCRAKSHPSGGRQCKGPSAKATPKIRLMPPVEDRDVFAEAVARAEVDGLTYDALLSEEPSELRRQLLLYGVATMDALWGLDHRVFFKPEMLAQVELPDGMESAPLPSPEAGQVVLGVHPVSGEGPWNPVQGLLLRWIGEGNAEARYAYLHAIASWLAAFFSRISPPRLAAV